MQFLCHEAEARVPVFKRITSILGKYESFISIPHISIELNTRVIKSGQIPKLHVCLGLLVCEELHTFVMASAILVVIRAVH